MSLFQRRTEEYYQKFIELQEKLRKSEEERLKLEAKFNEMVRITREEEQQHYRRLRAQYKHYVDEDRQRQMRNERILRGLERAENRLAVLTAKTERVKMLRQQYRAMFLGRVTATTDDSIRSSSEWFKNNRVVDGEEDDTPVLRDSTIADDIMKSISSLRLRRESVKNLDLFDESVTNEIRNNTDKYRLLKEALVSQGKDQVKFLEQSGTMNIRRDHQESIIDSEISSKMNKIAKISNKEEENVDESANSDKISKQLDQKLNVQRQNLEVVVLNQEEIVKEELIKEENVPQINVQIGEEISNLAYLEDDRNDIKDTLSLQQQQGGKNNHHQSKLIDSLSDQQLNIEEASLKVESVIPENVENKILSNSDGVIGQQSSDNTDHQDDHNFQLQYEENQPLVVAQQRKKTEGLMQQYDEIGEQLPVQQYDENDQFIQQCDDENGQQYDENGQLIVQQYDDESGQEVIQQYDKTGQLIEKQYDETGQVNQQYDETGQIDQQYDETRQVFQQYDENGQIIPQYDETGQVIQQYDEAGQLIQQQYDETGQVVSQYNETGQIIPQYDETGQVIPQYDETGQPIQQQYDETGQVIQQYDVAGQVIPQYDETGQLIQQQYDETGQIIQQYDDTGQIIQQYDETAQVVQQYDETGQLIQQYNETGKDIQQQFDETGQLISPQYVESEYDQTRSNAHGNIEEYVDKEENLYENSGESEPRNVERTSLPQELKLDEETSVSHNQSVMLDVGEPTTDDGRGDDQIIQQSSIINVDQQDDDIVAETVQNIEEDCVRKDLAAATSGKVVMDMLDTDTETSVNKNKQGDDGATKDVISSNDSDFDFSSNNN